MRGLSCNVSVMYTALPFTERFEAAARDGFRCVEFWGADGADQAGDAAKAVNRLGLAVSVINVNPGRLANDFGQLGNPDLSDWWRREFERTVEFATELGCRHINLLAGGELPIGRDRQLETVIDNLSWALPTADKRGLTLLLEPLNATDRPHPLIRRPEDVLAIREALGDPPRVQLLFDAFHISQGQDDLSAAYQRSLPRVGHVQLADFPGRHEPGTGQIDIPRFIDCVISSGYEGWLGLEYYPLGGPLESLAWALDIPALQPFLGELAHRAARPRTAS